MRRKTPFILQGSRGFTLMELLVVIGIIAIGAAVALPTMIETLRDYRLRSATRAFFSTLQQAKLAAIKEHADVLIDNPSTSSYRLFVDEDGSGGYTAANDTLLKTIDVTEYKLTFDAFAPLGFNSRGGAIGAGTITINKDASRKKQVNLNVAGNIRVL